MEKCKQKRKHKCMFTILASSWLCNYLKIRLQVFRLENFATTTVDKKRACKTDNFVPLVVPGLSSVSGTSSSSTSILQDSSSSGSASDRSDEHAPGNLRDTDEIIQNQNKKRNDSGDPDVRLRDLSEWMKEFIDNLEDTELPPSAHVSQDSDSERPTNVISKSRKHSFFYSLPTRPKFRSMFANDNYEDSLQKTHWRSSTSSRKVWRLDDGWTQSS